MISEATKKKYGDPYDFTHPVNPQTGLRVQLRSVWGFGGWYANALDAALRHDDPDAFVEIMRAGEMDSTTTTLDGQTMQQYCRKREAKKCEKALKDLEKQEAIRTMSAEKRGEN